MKTNVWLALLAMTVVAATPRAEAQSVQNQIANAKVAAPFKIFDNLYYITNHAAQGGIFERAERLKLRKPGEPHPFVAPQDFRAWLVDLDRGAQTKLVQEQQAAATRK